MYLGIIDGFNYIKKFHPYEGRIYFSFDIRQSQKLPFIGFDNYDTYALLSIDSFQLGFNIGEAIGYDGYKVTIVIEDMTLERDSNPLMFFKSPVQSVVIGNSQCSYICRYFFWSDESGRLFLEVFPSDVWDSLDGQD